MIYLLDTGPLVAALRSSRDNDPYTPWAVRIIRSLPAPLFTCDAVLTEASHFLGSAVQILQAIERGLLVSHFEIAKAAPRLTQLVQKYSQMDFADACLVYMSEQVKDCKIITIDRADFTVYRRHGREVIPLLLPD